MPYYQCEIYDEDEAGYDEEEGDEVEEEDEKEPEMTEETYEPAGTTARFDSDLFTKDIRDELVAKGISAVNCHYDGGYDEGFAHFDNVVREGTTLTPAELIELLQDSRILDPSLTSGMFEGYPPEAFKSLFGEMAASTTGVRIAATLEEFAQRLAWQLLGQGFGTGECTIRGRFRADLETGELIDLKDGE
jgi:hypothetical protein